MSTLALKNDQSWLISFSDLLILLLTFFVLRYSMYSADPQVIPKPIIKPKIEVIENRKLSFFEELRIHLANIHQLSSLNEPTKSFRFSSLIEIYPHGLGALTTLGTGTFYPGTNELTFQAREQLTALGYALKNKPYEMNIEAHSSNASVGTGFISNWDLSLAQALTVKRQLIDASVGEQSVSIAGYGGSKPENQFGKRQDNRVEIYLYKVN